MRMLACALTTLCLAACATASPAPVATPTPAPLPKPIPASCRPELLTPPPRPSPLPPVLTVREGLMIGAGDGAQALSNAMMAVELQTCVRDLLAQRIGGQ